MIAFGKFVASQPDYSLTTVFLLLSQSSICRLSWHGLALQEVLKHDECLPRAMQGNLMTCSSDSH
jgi:hypothetical protein